MTTIRDRSDKTDDLTSTADTEWPEPVFGGPLSAAMSAEVESSAERPVGLPQHISGGFLGVTEELDRRGRDWSLMVRLLEQQRLHLETAEQEQVRLYTSLEAILPAVQESGRALQSTVATTKGGDVSANLSALFVENLRTLDELENVAKALTANLLWTRSSWEQYARSVIGAQKMRDDLRN